MNVVPRPWPDGVGAPSGDRRDDLKLSVLDSAGFSVMVGMGEAYLAAFVLALGLDPILAGLIASVPMIAGGVLQLFTPSLVLHLGSHRRFVVLAATTQALTFLPLIAGALLGRLPGWVVFLAATLYWGSGMATGPSWNAWIQTLVPRRVRARYFSRRARLAQGVVLASTLAGGLLLELGASAGRPLLGFAATFTCAFFGRLTSARLLARHSEPSPLVGCSVRLGVLDLVGKMRGTREGKLLRYLLAVQMSVHFSAPYIAPFMLNHLKLSYAEFMTLSATTLMAKVIAAPLFGEIARRTGPRRLLSIGGVAIIPIAGLLVVSDSYPYLLFVQFSSGVAWAAYELAGLLILFEAIPSAERTSLLTLNNFANACATVLGALAGATVARLIGDPEYFYGALFLGSTLFRFATLALLQKVPDDAPHARMSILAFRPVAVRQEGELGRPILPSLDAEPEGTCESPPK